MGEVNNLSAAEAVAMIRKISDEIGTYMFCTRSANGKLYSRPMSALKVDDQGSVWFLSDKNSDKNKALGQDAIVDLFYGKGMDNYIFVFGKNAISSDKQVIKNL